MKLHPTENASCIAAAAGEPVASDRELAAICKALAHPARIRILQYLKEVDGCVCGRIVEILPLAQSTVSQHLKILKEAGLVRGEVEGPRTCYCLDRQKLARFKALANGL
jgi:DNA-binding transcriptional ArsR family regulator